MRAKRRLVALVVLAIPDEATERGPHFAAVHESLWHEADEPGQSIDVR